ncbi:MAG: universal stress protein [Bacteroidetes bacterium]|nr:MAG: universal stress protein [Bacteroidota bacterium]
MEFDLHKLTKRPSFPFETIAVGLSFSPRMDLLLTEAKKIADACSSKLVLIHVGEKTKEKQKSLEDILFRNNIEERKVKIIWSEGDVVDMILKLCKLNIVDLLILGALERENIIKFYLGSIARTISRKAKCSVLLLTQAPSVQKLKQRMIVNAGADHPKTVPSINTALYFAKHMGVKEVSMVHEVHSPALAMAMAESSSAPEVTKIKKEYTEEESTKLHSLIAKCDTGNIKINEKVIKGKPGYAIRQYAETKKADLLVINSPDMHLTFFDRIFTHDIEYILADLPCNLLIVHSRV